VLSAGVLSGLTEPWVGIFFGWRLVSEWADLGRRATATTSDLEPRIRWFWDFGDFTFVPLLWHPWKCGYTVLVLEVFWGV
jgi:hypothetical protein